MAAGHAHRLAGIIGWPIGHSRSPLIHSHWLREYAIAGDYVPMAVRPEALPAAIKGLAALGFAGCNVTIPHKVAVMPLLDEVDPVARRIGAVNTIVVRGGMLAGTNTDARGFAAALAEAQPDWRAGERPVVVLGAGGGARAIVVALSDLGVREIRVTNRTDTRAAALAAELGTRVRSLPWASRNDALADVSLLVNTTSLGMVGEPPLELSLDRLPREAVVSDIVYNPELTPLLTAAQERGNPTMGGLGMLLHQAAAAFEAWFDMLPRVTPELHRIVAETL